MSTARTTICAAAIAGCALLVLALSSGRAFHMDDALYLRWARDVAQHPLDPYAGEANWHGVSEPLLSAIRNPPLAGWALALLGSATGWSARALHLAQLVPSAVFLAASWTLARRWCARPLVALAIVAFSPAFLVTSATIMADTALAAAWTCALVCWCRPVRRGDSLCAALAALLAGLTKWYGLALVPLLLAWELLLEARLTRRCLWLLLPLAAALALDLWMRVLHGVSIFAHAASIAADRTAQGGALLQLALGLAFLGGACAGCLPLFALLARSRPALLGATAALACALALFASGRFERWPTLAQASAGERGAIALQLGVWIFAGALLLALSLRGGTSARFLALWILGTFVFAVFLNWGILVRSFLPALPALAIVLANALDRVPFLARPAGARVLAAGLGVGALFGVLLLRADTEVADEARASATSLVEAHRQSQVWFEGHWGFQHYAEAAGARALDREHPAARAGDVILVPLLNANVFGVSPERTRTLERHIVPLRSPFVVLGPRSGAGFWADQLGPLPCAWNLGEVAETWVFELR